MSLETILIVGGVAVMFISFGAALVWAERQTHDRHRRMAK